MITETISTSGATPSKANTIDLLRRINPASWAEVEEPSGWTYHTNIGHLAHMAADEIERHATLLAARDVQLAAQAAELERLRAFVAKLDIIIESNYVEPGVMCNAIIAARDALDTALEGGER